MATSVLPDATCWMTTQAANRHAGTGGLGAEMVCVDLTKMFQGTEYYLTGGSNIIVTSGDDEHQKSDAFIKKNETAVFSFKTYWNWPTTEILEP